jgi:hypothetical protein
MHEVSPETVQAAQEHALQLIQQGKHVTDIAQKLQKGDSREVELAQNLEPYSETIQEHANKSLNLAESLESNPSSEVLGASAKAHIEAVNAHRGTSIIGTENRVKLKSLIA